MFGNNRGVPLPERSQEDVLEVGGLRFTLDEADVHQAGDYVIHLDKNDKTNAYAGMLTAGCGARATGRQFYYVVEGLHYQFSMYQVLVSIDSALSKRAS